MMIDDFKQSVSGVGSKLTAPLPGLTKRVTKLEDKQEGGHQGGTEGTELHQGDFATTFVLREDFFRSMNGVEDRCGPWTSWTGYW